jgi:putative transposase
VDILSRDERIDLVEPGSGEISLSRQAELLGLNRSGLYYRPVPVSEEEVGLKHRIDEIYTEYPFFGSRRITVLLRAEGWTVNRKAVVRHMQEMGIEAIYPGPNLSKRDLQHRIYPYLLRGMTIEKPNHVWGIDITYIRLQRGWMYLVAIIDWFSRFIVSWELEQTLEIEFVLEAVRNGIRRAKPEIFNSDQGSHFTSPQYIDILKDADISISMDGKGRAIDNVFTERFWRSLKYEEVYLKDYATPREARAGIRNYMDFYNTRRPHQSLSYSTPAVVYAGRK